MTWTEQMDATLIQCCRQRKPSWEVAEMLGVTQAAARGRAGRLGMRFPRTATRRKRVLDTTGHKAFTPRCAELLRAAGVPL